MWHRFATAVCFLTILPLPLRGSQRISSVDLAGSLAFFPLVGLLLGACAASTAYVLHLRMPPFLLAVLVTALITLLTRGLHLDGLADLADGVGGGHTPARRLEIMKDSRTGAFGVIAITLALLFKVAAIQTLITAKDWLPILIIPVFTRLAMVLAAYKSPYARPEGGLGQSFLEHMNWRHLFVAALLAAAVSLPFDPLHTGLYAATVPACAAVLRYLGRQWLGGVTGDVLGAVNEITELVLLVLSASLVYP